MSSELLNQSVGKVNYHPDKVTLLGTTGEVEDGEPGSSGSQLQKRNSGMLIKVRLVKFTAALAPGSRVKYTSGKAGTEVEQAGAEQANGIVDPFLPANTADGDIGLIFTEGPMDVIASAAIAVNAKVKGAASGKVATDATVGDNLSEGVAIEAAAADGDKIRALMQFKQY